MDTRMSEQDPHAHDALADLLREATTDFGPGFADRVMSRLEARRAEDAALERAMQRQFKRWMPLGFAAGLALAAFNVTQAGGDASHTAIEAALGLDPLSVGYAYSIEIPGMDITGDES
jgi:hypothetical protein